ncbi:MAG: RDD family protein [Saccharospirillum sp.]
MTTQPPTPTHPGMLRLIGALLYDWLIVLGLLMLAGFVAVGVNKALTGHDAIAAGNPLFVLWNLGIIYLYFAGFWMGKRQTVGMKAWRLHLETLDQTPLTWTRSLKRFACALPAWGVLLIGILWRYTHPDRLSWPDRFSQTRLVYTPKHKA